MFGSCAFRSCPFSAVLCPRQHVPANGSVRIAFTQITGFSASGTKVLVWEYRLVAKGSRYEQRDFVSRTFTVR